jgi:hypothetical protein
MVRKLFLNGILSVLVVAGMSVTATTFAQSPREGASGHGTLLVTDTSGDTARRQFSFSANRRPDGTVNGQASLRNPAYTGANGQVYQLKVDISCMKVYGNIAVFGGTTRRTNDPNLVDAVYFSVQDNGEPGKDRDQISSVYFFDDDPTTVGDPQLCQVTGPNDFLLMPIESGNVQVRQ